MGTIIEEFKEKSLHTIDVLRDELKGIRVGRPSAALVEDIKVDHYGQLTPLSHVSSITVRPPREINIQVWDKEAVKPVVSAIESSSLGLSVSADGNTIRVFLPELSKERKDELKKHIKSVIEEYRIRIRQERDEYNKKADDMFEKKEIDEDKKFRLRKEIQEETEKINGEIEEVFERKKKEIES